MGGDWRLGFSFAKTILTCFAPEKSQGQGPASGDSSIARALIPPSMASRTVTHGRFFPTFFERAIPIEKPVMRRSNHASGRFSGNISRGETGWGGACKMASRLKAPREYPPSICWPDRKSTRISLFALLTFTAVSTTSFSPGNSQRLFIAFFQNLYHSAACKITVYKSCSVMFGASHKPRQCLGAIVEYGKSLKEAASGSTTSRAGIFQRHCHRAIHATGLH